MYRGLFVRMGGFGAGILVTSSAVSTPSTPSILSAADVSMFFTRACGMGLVSSRQNTMPSARKSSEYFASPVTFASTSCGVKFLPMSL
jgi:hypothetical protein